MSPGPSAVSSSMASHDRLGLVADDRLALGVARRRRLLDQRPVAHLDRVGRARRPRRSGRRPAGEVPANRSGSIVAEVMTTFRSGRRGSSCLR